MFNLKNSIISTWGALTPIRNYVKRSWFTFILYHQICPEILEKHLDYLVPRYNITHLDTLRDHYMKGSPLPKNSLFITFDDGWKSNYDLLPILEEREISVTIFLTVSSIGSQIKPGPLSRYHEFTIKEIEKNPITLRDRTMLNKEEIIQMSKVFNFQSHGVHHHPATHLSLEQLKGELIESRIAVEKITGNSVYAYAYPYNRATNREAKIVENCGYTLARIGGRTMNLNGAYPFLLNCIGIEEDCTVKSLQRKIIRAELKTLLTHVL